MPSILDWRVVPQGQHNATIDKLNVNFSAVTWLKIGYRIQLQGEDYSDSGDARTRRATRLS